MVTSEGHGEESTTTPRAPDEPTLKAKDFEKMKKLGVDEDEEDDDELHESHQSTTSSHSSGDGDVDSSSGDETDDEEDLPEQSFHGVLPGSVIAAYLADPVANPAAQSLYTMTASRGAHSLFATGGAYEESPRPRGADQVLTLRQPPHLVDEKPRNCYSAATPSTSNFISLVTDFDASLAHPSCCMVTNFVTVFFVSVVLFCECVRVQRRTAPIYLTTYQFIHSEVHVHTRTPRGRVKWTISCRPHIEVSPM
ncbi:hypothetical protein OSTOST_10633 [Ostertagia ostertagi]